MKIFRKYQLTSPEFPSNFIEAASETNVPRSTKYIEYSLKTVTFMFQQSFRDCLGTEPVPTEVSEIALLIFLQQYQALTLRRAESKTLTLILIHEEGME